jgi:hypothetical protein
LKTYNFFRFSKGRNCKKNKNMLFEDEEEKEEELEEELPEEEEEE